MRMLIRCFIFVTLAVLADAKDRKNVLLIIADDMRAEATPFHDDKYLPWLYPKIKTPNLEKLADESYVFRRAYAQVARCNPSRSSFLTSRRSDTLGVHTNDDFFREKTRSHLITLPEFFTNNGYTTSSFGKVFHTLRSDMQDQDFSWTDCSIPVDPIFNCRYEMSWMGVTRDLTRRKPFGDLLLRDKVEKRLDKYAQSEKNFFMVVGFQRPHLPFTVPEVYLEQYADHDIKPAEHSKCAQGMPDIAWGDSEELMHYLDIKVSLDGKHWKLNSTLSDEKAIELRRAYYACVTYIDDMLGQVLKKLDDVGLRDDTIVVFMADHGFHLGENGAWGKNTVLETSLHVPLMISIPGVTKKRKQLEELVELVDLYPTLVEAAGFEPPPTCPERDSDLEEYCTEGSSLMPLLKEEDIKWKERVFSQSQYPLYAGEAKYEGYSMRNQRYRYTEWIDNQNGVPKNWPEPQGVELYDLAEDPNQLVNIAYDDDHKLTVKRLSQDLHGGWVEALPTKQ